MNNNIMSNDIDTIISSVFYLMSRFQNTQSQDIAKAINYHLDLLENHPDMASDVIRNTCSRLKKHWGQLSKNKNINININSSYEYYPNTNNSIH